jgi:leader peptidase (prepilin peptidase)/N-methyltransferase
VTDGLLWLIGALAALALGLVVGSLVAHLAARLPLDAPILGPPICLRTRCRLPWADVVPIWGYLRRRGRCRLCGEALPRWWPLTEAGMALLALLAYISAGGWNARFGLYVLDLAVLLAVLLMDWRRHEIYTLMLLIGAGAGLLGALVFGEFNWGGILVGGAVGGGIMLAMYGLGQVLGRALYGREGLAWGDVELGAMLGLMTGFPGIVTPLFWGPVVGILLFLRRGLGRYFPFAPGLCLVTMAFLLIHTSDAPLWDTLRLPWAGQILWFIGQIIGKLALDVWRGIFG